MSLPVHTPHGRPPEPTDDAYTDQQDLLDQAMAVIHGAAAQEQILMNAVLLNEDDPYARQTYTDQLAALESEEKGAMQVVQHLLPHGPPTQADRDYEAAFDRFQGASVLALDTGSTDAGSTVADPTRVVHSAMADTGNAFGDVYGALPRLASGVGPTNMTLALADQTRRTVSTAFQSSIFLHEDDEVPLHLATGYVLPSGGNDGDREQPIFSIPKWNDAGWGISLPPPPARGYMYFRDRPEKIYLDRSPGKLWKLLYRWRAPGEMLLISAHLPGDPLQPGCHVALMSEDPTDRDVASSTADDLPSEAELIRSLSWTPILYVAPTTAPCQPETVDYIHGILASVTDTSSPTTAPMPPPNTTCPAALALLRGQVNDSLCAAVSLSHPGVQIQSAEDFHTRFGHLSKKYMRWFLKHRLWLHDTKF